MTHAPAPRLAVVVHNGITGDSRVIKTAIAASRAGWDVLLLGWARDKVRAESRLGPVRVVRAPLVRTFQDRRDRVAAGVGPAGAPGGQAAGLSGRAFIASTLERAHGLRQVRKRPRLQTRLDKLVAEVAGPEPAGGRPGPPHPLPSTRRATEPEEVVWRHDWPIFNDWWLSYEPELAAFDPDVIHANDAQMIGGVARYAAAARLRGRPVRWLYDAHELVSAVDWGGPLVSAAYRQVEAEFIGQADAVVTISPVMAATLQEQHSLAQTPGVVANAPVAAGVAAEVSLREVCGLEQGVPLLVYSGFVAAKRGLDVAVEALPHLDGVHLALVCGGSGPVFEALIERASALGVADRVHQAPYVAPAAVPDYLSSADIGLAPFHWTANYDSSLPTKVPEYLHARLPIVASDMKVMARFVEDHGIGAVFPAGSVEGFAEAVRRVLAQHPQMRAAITEELLDHWSWERQAATLTETYARISGLRPSPADVPWEQVEIQD
jgi:glycosyltransferase involved in cell wall biosynthesis